MSGKDGIEGNVAGKPVQRLCSEIQLFDLCDLERCDHKEGRFCTNGELLVRFERISEKDDMRPLVDDSYRSEEVQEDGDDLDEDVYGESDALDDRDDDDLDDWKDD